MGNLWNKFFFTSGIQADKIVAHIMLTIFEIFMVVWILVHNSAIIPVFWPTQ